MSKLTTSVQKSDNSESNRQSKPSSASTRHGKSVAVQKTGTISAGRGNLKTMVEELLDALTGAVKASSGIVKILPAHGRAMQIFSTAGIPDELFEMEDAANLNCEAVAIRELGEGILSVDFCVCKERPNCRFRNYMHQSLMAVPLGSKRSQEHSKGYLTLFFDAQPDSYDQVSKTVHAFVRLLNSLLEQNQSNREAKRVDLIAERQSIANEIHDSLAQTLVYARMRTNMLIESIQTKNEQMAEKYAHDIDEALEIGQKTVRELIKDFRCEIDPSGLLHALRNLVDQFCERNDITLEYINRIADFDLPLEYEIQVYYIVREALANIANHSEANKARLMVEGDGENFVFTIEDNGKGGCFFTPVEGHYGIMIMRERAARIHGEIKIDSKEGSGTKVQLIFQVTNVRKELGK